MFVPILYLLHLWVSRPQWASYLACLTNLFSPLAGPLLPLSYGNDMREADMGVINCNLEDNVGLSEMSARCVTLFKSNVLKLEGSASGPS